MALNLLNRVMIPFNVAISAAVLDSGSG